MGSSSSCSDDKHATADSFIPSQWRKISKNDPNYDDLFFDLTPDQLLDVHVEMIKELAIFMNCLHSVESVGYSVLKTKRQVFLSHRYQCVPASSSSSENRQLLSSNNNTNSADVLDCLLDGEEEEAAARKIIEEKKASETDKNKQNGKAMIESLNSLKECQLMFAVACALGKLTDARDIYELRVKKLQKQQCQKVQKEETQNNTKKNKNDEDDDVFDINKPLPVFHHPDFDPGRAVRWSPLQLAISAFNATAGFMGDGIVDLGTLSTFQQRNLKLHQTLLEYDIKLRNEKDHRIYDYDNYYLNDAIEKLMKKKEHKHNYPALTDVHTPVKVPPHVEEANKRRLADFVEFLLSEGADPNGNREETIANEDRAAMSFLSGKGFHLPGQARVPLSEREKLIKEGIEKGKYVMQQHHPLFLAIRGYAYELHASYESSWIHMSRTPNDLVVGELLAHQDTIGDPLSRSVHKIELFRRGRPTKFTFKNVLIELCDSKENGTVFEEDNNNNDKVLPPRLQAVSLLIARGADKNFVGEIADGKLICPLSVAYDRQNVELIKLLRANGCVMPDDDS